MSTLPQKRVEAVEWRLRVTDWLLVLKNITEIQSYYVGGTLVVDFPEGCFGMNLSNGSVTEMDTALSKPLSAEEHRLLFEIYRQHRGETDYYRDNLHLCPTGE